MHRRSRPPGGCPPSIPTCRTFRCAGPRGGASARRSSRGRAGCCWRPTTRRSSCASWRISRVMRVCARRSPRIATCTGRRPRRCLASARKRSPPITAAHSLGSERGAAQQYVERYFQRYPGVKRFMDETRAQARQIGYVETVFGRRLYLPDIRSGNTQLRQYAERSAINAPMQGTAADIIKRAMITLDAWCSREDAPARLIMQVHDELVLEVRADAVEQVSTAVRERMVNAASLSVPLRVDVGTGANWDEAHEAAAGEEPLGRRALKTRADTSGSRQPRGRQRVRARSRQG